jgi:signal transduction histidine kinase
MFEGNIIVLLDCKPKQADKNKKENNEIKQFQDEETHIFETEIIDTGIGISEERQDMLFVPFMELKMR